VRFPGRFETQAASRSDSRSETPARTDGRQAARDQATDRVGREPRGRGYGGGVLDQGRAGLLVRTGGLPPRPTSRSVLRFSGAEREEISRGLLAGDRCGTSPAACGEHPRPSRARCFTMVAGAAIVPGAARPLPYVGRVDPRSPSCAAAQDCGVRWSACSSSAGRPSRSRGGSGSIIRMIGRCGCRTKIRVARRLGRTHAGPTGARRGRWLDPWYS
jgi:hypothetical protein